MVSLGLMGWTAFGPDRSGWSRSMQFVLLSMALGGLAVSLETGGAGLPLCAGGLAALCRMGLRSRGGEKVPITVTYRGRTVRGLALRDTGNTLRDPITGEAVTVLSPALGEKLGIPEEVFRDPAGAMLPGLRLIPARTVGGGGLLAAVRCDLLTIDGKPSGTLAAFARENFGNGEYQALTGGSYG